MKKNYLYLLVMLLVTTNLYAYKTEYIVNYGQITRQELMNRLPNGGSEIFSALLAKKYVYEIGMWGPYTQGDSSVTKLLLGQIPQVIIGGLIQYDPDLTSAKIKTDAGPEFNFVPANTWYNVSSYCNAENIIVTLGGDGITSEYYIGATLSLWVGLDTSLGDAINYEELMDTNTTNLYINGYEIVNEHSLPISYNTITEQEREEMFGELGMTQNYIYCILIGAHTGYDWYYTFIKMHFGHIAGKVMAYSVYGDESLSSVGKNEDDLYWIDNFEWNDVTEWCNASDWYARVGIFWVNHSGDDLLLCVGFNSSIGNYLTYDIVGHYEGPDYMTIQGFQVGSDVSIASPNLAYEPVTKPDIDTLFMDDGANDFISQFRDYNYLYRFDLYSKLNLTKGNKIIVHLNDAADKVIAYSNGTTRQLATIGKVLTQQQLFGVGAWKEVTQYADVKDFYIVMIDDPNQHYPGHLRMWLGTNDRLGQSLTYETVDLATPPDSFFVRAFRRSDKAVENIHILTPSTGKAAWLWEGDQYYFDRDYYIVSIPDSLRNMVWIKTANDDKKNTADSLLKIKLDRPANVFIGYDHRATIPPPWLADSFTQTNFNIDVLDFASPLQIWRQYIPAGTIDLGGNMAGGAIGAKSNYIVLVDLLEPAPVAAFGADTTAGVIPFTVTFADSSSGAITSWLWNFGDGETSDQQNPVHVYTTADTFNVSLTVAGPGGADTETKQNYVIAFASPVAAFTYEEVAEPPLTVNFHDVSTGIITSWMWDFGDGDFSTEQHTFHTFAQADTFTVFLLVEGPGGSNSKTQNIIVTGGQPIAEFEADSTSGVRPFSVQFYDRSAGIVASRSWDFGDGASSDEQHPLHVYTTADTFSVSLTVTGPGGSDTMTKTDYIIVKEQPPVAAFAADSTSGKIPFTVSFSDSSTGVISSWLWTFGDGQTSAEQNPVNVYTEQDTFTVSLTVSGPGGTDTETKTDYIIVKLPVGINDQWSGIPTDFQLRQNYPNPFNPQTTIIFGLPKTSQVTVAVYNLKGEIIETLYEGKKPAGYHNLVWNALNRPTGIYFIKMQAGSFMQVNKCVLVK